MQSPGPPSLLAGRYRLDQRKATGGYGEVWRALDTLLQRTVAVKLLRAEISGDSGMQARFRGEARHAGSVTHENIAQIYDYCEPASDQPAFLVMEYVGGPSLGEMLATGPLEPASAVDVVAQCAAGLQAAHQAGLVHRDIKPGNVLMAEGGRVKLTDFGISHVAGSVPVTATGALIGTPAYLAPERAHGARGSSSSDLYSLGVLAYHCLTGEVPFSGDPLQVALAHCTDPLPPLPGSVPAGVAALVDALTAKDPADRPESAAAVAAWAADLRDQLRTSAPGLADTAEDVGVLAAALSGVPDAEALALAARANPPPRPRWRRLAVLLPAAAIVAALTAVLLISMINQSPQHVAAAGPSQGAMVSVDGKTLLGKPVPAVRRQLLHLGLDVQVRWQPSNRMPPGRVLSVKPTGLLPRGSTVVLIGALTPGSAGQGTPTSPGPHGRSGTSRHRGSQSHPSGQPPPTGSPAPSSSPTSSSSPTPTVSPTPTPSPSTTLTPAGSHAAHRRPGAEPQ
jgi:eukaryotic-like serine/threonine-protein kinase